MPVRLNVISGDSEQQFSSPAFKDVIAMRGNIEDWLLGQERIYGEISKMIHSATILWNITKIIPHLYTE